jgi:F-type H+-transporting ATPase subunit epsilon
MPLQVELVSPERILYSGEASMVIARTAGGDIAFLSGHAPFLGALGIGAVRVQGTDGRELQVAVHGGFVEVKDDRVIILSDVAELPDQIDAERAHRAREAAEAAIRAEHTPEQEAALRRAETRIAVASSAR